jgi:hypothetical protein
VNMFLQRKELSHHWPRFRRPSYPMHCWR